MRPAYAASLVAALVCHALLLFGFKLDIAARPLDVSDNPSSVDVSLVAAAPESPPQETATPPEPESTPAPAPPMPAPTPEMSTPPPAPEATPVQETASAAPREVSHETPAPHPLARKHAGKISHAPASSTTQGVETHQGASAGGPVGISARYLSNPKPDYPEQARSQHEEGIVLLSVEVNAEGHATDVTLRRSSGYALLDEAAIRAVRRWIFEPARVASLPVASRVDVPIRFSLTEYNNE